MSGYNANVTRPLALLTVVAVCSAPALATKADDIPAATLRELAGVRAATAKYHDVAAAEADGYVEFGPFEAGEGYHWVKFSLLDGEFDAEQPPALLYTKNKHGHLQLVAVEYVIPLASQPPGVPPVGFTGPADVWTEDSEGLGFWELIAWIWSHNPDGIFARHNPLIVE